MNPLWTAYIGVCALTGGAIVLIAEHLAGAAGTIGAMVILITIAAADHFGRKP